MPDPPSPPAGSLSARAQEILRRADSQLAALRGPAPPAPLAPPPADCVEPPGPERPARTRDLGELLDTVEAGIGAARAHLVALSASLERVAEEIGRVAAEQGVSLPASTTTGAAAATSAEDAPADGPPVVAPEPATDPESEPEPPPAPPAPEPPAPPASDAAHDAARLVAIEMAVAGDTREGVGRRLREEFGIRDPRGILDDAFGPETAGRTRRPYR